MGTKKHNIIIITASVIVSAAIWIITMKSHSPQHIDSRVFKVVNGWGYDILVNDSIMIHQESIPVVQNHQPFARKEQAEKTARLIIQKIKTGQHPTLTKFDLDKILRSDEPNNEQGNLE
ncbi:MAG: DUF4907 domain-containing protein [Bacteroidota bacterium]